MTEWRRSTRCSTTSCVEVKFVKSTYSADSGNCVEVGSTPDAVYVRDSKADNDGTVLSFPPADWRAFVADLK